MSTISPITDKVTTSNTRADDIWTPEQAGQDLAQVFRASFITAATFGRCGYAAAADIAAKVVQEAISETIEGRAP